MARLAQTSRRPVHLGRATTALMLLPVLLLGAIGSAEPVVYQQAAPGQTPTIVGTGGVVGNGRLFAANAPTLLPGQLGVMVANLSGPDQLFYKREAGAVIEQVVPNSPAERAGLLRNDVILAIDDQPVVAAADVVAALQGTVPGQRKEIRLLRDQQEKTVVVAF